MIVAAKRIAGTLWTGVAARFFVEEINEPQFRELVFSGCRLRSALFDLQTGLDQPFISNGSHLFED